MSKKIYTRTIFRAIHASTYQVMHKEIVQLSPTAAYKRSKELRKEFPACNISQVTHYDDLAPHIQAFVDQQADSEFWKG